MQRAKNMAETLKFVYVLILFISIFLVIMICDSAFFPPSRICTRDKDCLPMKNHIARCHKGICQQRKLR